jgi:hypothetical protein
MHKLTFKHVSPLRGFVGALFLSAVAAIFPPGGFAAEAPVSEVISRGIGTSADAALKDALAQAVQQVVGAMIDSESMMKNDALIKEQVLTYSDGFVTKYEIVKPAAPLAQGLFEVTIRATVAQKQLRDRLQQANILRVKVDGMENIWAQLQTEQIRRDNADLMLMKVLSQLHPFDYVQATLVDKDGNTGTQAKLAVTPSPDGTRAKVSIAAVLQVDQRKFVNEALPVLIDAFDKLCVAKSKPIVVATRTTPSKHGLRFREDGTLETGMFYDNSEPAVVTHATIQRDGSILRQTRGPQNTAQIALNVSRRYNPAQQTFVCYFFSGTQRLYQFLNKTFCDDALGSLILVLRDAQGDEISRCTIPVQRNSGYCGQIIRHWDIGDRFVLSPEVCEGSWSFSNRTVAVFDIDLDINDLKDVKSMELVLEKNQE